MKNINTNLSIIGLGAASYAAALYAVRYQIPTIMIGADFGGETATGGLIENYPGIPEIDGYDLMLKMKEQVSKYDIKTIEENAGGVVKNNQKFLITCANTTVNSKSIILGIGRERRKLHLDNEENLVGKGVSYCSTCDAPLYKDKITAVVGGGNAAIEGALLLSKYASKVYLIYRGNKIYRPDPVLIKHLNQTRNITTLLNTNVTKLLGDNETGLTAIEITNNIEETKTSKIDGLFIEIGADPRLEIPNQLGLRINPITNEVHVNNLMETNVAGIFAAGDLTDASGNLKQTVTAAGQGAISALSAYNYLNQQ